MFEVYWDRHRVFKKDRRLEGCALQMSKKLFTQEKPKSQLWQTTRVAVCGLPDLRQPDQSLLVLHHTFPCGAKSYPGHTGSYFDELSKILKARIQTFPDDSVHILRLLTVL